MLGFQATTYALTDLYSHQDYVEPLRNEADGPMLAELNDTAEGLPLLDSFLKESARFSAFESSRPPRTCTQFPLANTFVAGVHRQASRPFAFSDGLRISKGDWVCVPHRSMMRDDRYFDNALEFDAFRSVNMRAKSCGGFSPFLQIVLLRACLKMLNFCFAVLEGFMRLWSSN